MTMDENLARLRAHHNNISRYRRLLRQAFASGTPVHRTATFRRGGRSAKPFRFDLPERLQGAKAWSTVACCRRDAMSTTFNLGRPGSGSFPLALLKRFFVREY
ncbi:MULTISPECIES: hypothetical protein [unclassified Bradyrhizobium]|jgi:hypothetical protein